jgi:hypothetical protein
LGSEAAWTAAYQLDGTVAAEPVRHSLSVLLRLLLLLLGLLVGVRM